MNDDVLKARQTGFKQRLMRLIPEPWQLPARFLYKRWTGQLEDELLMLREIVGPCKCAVDIGANIGFFSYALSHFCDRVEAFEPIPHCAASIEAHRAANIRVHNVGLSSQNGSLTLHVPVLQGVPIFGFASFREVEGNPLCITVPVRKLDDFHFQKVSFIKVDVEGHESDVLEGGRETILRDKPILLIEIEQRHILKPIEAVFNQVLALGYEGYFLQNRALRPLSEFSYKIHQEPYLVDVMNRNYVNDFIFEPHRS